MNKDEKAEAFAKVATDAGLTPGQRNEPRFLAHESHEMRHWPFMPADCYWCDKNDTQEAITRTCACPDNPMLSSEEKRARPFVCDVAKKLTNSQIVDEVHKFVQRHGEYARLARIPMTIVVTAEQWFMLKANAVTCHDMQLFGYNPDTFAGYPVELHEDRERAKLRRRP